jgi:hypothetical protein
MREVCHVIHIHGQHTRLEPHNDRFARQPLRNILHSVSPQVWQLFAAAIVYPP